MEKKTVNFQNIVYSSTVSSIFVSLICTPLDVVKNYIQYNSNTNIDKKYIVKKITKKNKEKLVQFNSFYYQTFKNIYNKYGIQAVYRGLVSTTNLYIVNNTLFFYVYEELKERGVPYYLCATISRFISIIVTSPLEIYRTNVQANVCNNFKVSIFDMFGDKKNRRIKINLYKGITSTLIRDIPFSAIYWSMNEYLVNYIKRKDKEYENRKNYIKKFVYPFICACLSSTITTFITHPLDIIKTNMQARCIDIIHKNDFDHRKIKNYDLNQRHKMNSFYSIFQSNIYNNRYLWDVKVSNYAHNNHRSIYYKYGAGKYGSNTYSYKYYNYFKLTNNYNYNVFSVAKLILKKNGIKGFYIGICPRLVKIVPTCAILFSTYHYFNR
ncbi:mitochondrial carrier protein, putative [Plasmodium chabaudi chabaudi]|uniref:Mitochondrial carrier protein, putative n=2 Tax=Plasmodium chabaudi TaxID=5825 RepID=A0A1C6XDL6_PLACU|nr:mitochondrial carrier protein, putative [Plasmodium chabaudi chabaudi]SCM03665.1 mitochondrial carrier protein, putative [Plasmodium chabaudi chabaudi]SCM06646.1 mitochondrial carrier protein, putative [Plasmodium chabaudi adami]